MIISFIHYLHIVWPGGSSGINPDTAEPKLNLLLYV